MRFDIFNVSTPIRALINMLGNVLILLFAVLSVGYLGLCVFAHFASDAMIFPAPPASYLDDAETLKLKSTVGDQISAYFLKAEDSGEVLLYSHGNGEDLGDIRPVLTEFQQKGISVFAYDYPGYGTSTGVPSESGAYAAADAAMRYLIDELGYKPESITLYGRSLGGGPSCWLAERYSVAGLILDGTFTSTFRVMTKVKILPFDKFDNLSRLPNLNCPVLMIDGKQDRVVTFSHALKNEKVLAEEPETLWIEDAGHNNLIELAGDSYWDTVIAFIQKNTST